MSLSGIVPLVIVLALLAVMMLSGRGSESSTNEQTGEVTGRGDSHHWIGPFYRNPDDPNLFVPKRYGLGRTVNVGRPLGIVIIFIPIALAAGVAILQMRH